MRDKTPYCNKLETGGCTVVYDVVPSVEHFGLYGKRGVRSTKRVIFKMSSMENRHNCLVKQSVLLFDQESVTRSGQLLHIVIILVI